METGDGRASDLPSPISRLPSSSTYALARFLILRLLALVYGVAFLVAARQLDPLLGSNGLLPAAQFLMVLKGPQQLPGIEKVVGQRDVVLFTATALGQHTEGWIGVGLSAAVFLGVTNALVQFALWALYLSFVQIGQLFYGYGWESQLLETGFLAIFLCPLRSVRPLRAPPLANSAISQPMIG